MDEVLINEPDDIFDDYEAVSDHEEENTEEAANAATTNGVENAETIPVPKKRVIRNPRLKFDADRLCGERGIPILIEHFKDMKFKGKGHEREDLDKLLSALEHWTHRLYPSLKFSDCLRQIEKLGKKRPVQVCLGKIRMDMPILHSDFGRVDDDDVRRGSDSDTEITRGTEFDHLVEDYQQTLLDKELQNVKENDSISHHSQSSSVPNLHEASTSASNGITEGQRLKMEQNRKLAADRLRARLSNLNTALSSPANSFTSISSVATTSVNQASLNSKSNNNFAIAHSDDEGDLNFNAGLYKKPTKRFKIDSDDEDSVDIDNLVENSLFDEPNTVERSKGLPESPRCSSFHSNNSSQFPSSSRSKKSSQAQNDGKMENADILFQNLSNIKEQHNHESSDSDVDTELVVHRRLKKKYVIDSDDDDNDGASELNSVKGGASQNKVISSDVNLSKIKNSQSKNTLFEGNIDAINSISDVNRRSQIDVMENQADNEKSDFDDDEMNISQKSAKKCRIESDDDDEMDEGIDSGISDNFNSIKGNKIETPQEITFPSDVNSAAVEDDHHSLLPGTKDFRNKMRYTSNYVQKDLTRNQLDGEKSDSNGADISPIYHKTKKCRIESDEDDVDIDQLVENSSFD